MSLHRRLSPANQDERVRVPLLIAAITAVIGLFYASTVASLIDLWNGAEYRHGVLIFPIAGYLVWRKRDALANVRVASWWPGLGLMLSLLVVWWLSRALDVQVTEQFAVVMLVPAAVATLLGLQVLRTLLFPLLFLVAAVPMGTSLVPLLMRVTADLSSALLRLSGVPVYREGQFLALPGGNFEVADVCAGWNYLIAGAILSMLFAYLTIGNLYKRVVFVAGTAVLLVLANAVRAYIVMLVASASNMKYLAGQDHIWFGWVLFALVIAGVFWIGARWAGNPPEEPTTGTERPSGPRSVWPLVIALVIVMLATTAQQFQATIGSNWKFLLPAGAVLLWLLIRQSGTPRGGADGPQQAPGRFAGRLSGGVGVAAIIALAAGPFLPTGETSTRDSAPSALAMPGVPECRAASGVPQWTSGLGETAEMVGVAAFDCGGARVHAAVAGFAGAAAREDLHKFIPHTWRVAPRSAVPFIDSAGHTVTVNQVTLHDRTLWYWYRIADRTATHAISAKLLTAYELFRPGAAPAAAYMLETPLDEDREAMANRLTAVAKALMAQPVSARKPAHPPLSLND